MRKTTKKHRKSRCPGRDSNNAPHTYNPKMVPTSPLALKDDGEWEGYQHAASRALLDDMKIYLQRIAIRVACFRGERSNSGYSEHEAEIIHKEIHTKNLHLSTLRTRYIVKSYTFWNITPCSPVKVNRRFGRTCHLNI
jgi:hypothetical protein